MYYDVGMTSSGQDDGAQRPPLSRCEVRLLDQGDGIVVVLRGELDLDDVSKVSAALRQALDETTNQLVVDLGSLVFIDSAGLKALVDIHDAASAAQVTFNVIAVSREVKRVIEMAGLGHLLVPS